MKIILELSPDERALLESKLREMGAEDPMWLGYESAIRRAVKRCFHMDLNDFEDWEFSSPEIAPVLARTYQRSFDNDCLGCSAKQPDWRELATADLCSDCRYDATKAIDRETYQRPKPQTV